MASLTDGAIRRAIKSVELEGKQKVLADGEGRGVGRLVLSIRPMPARVIAEWMAQQWRDGKRIKCKLGAYPSVSLAQARDLFKRDYADAIQKGRSIKIAGDTRPGTVADLFEAYVASLKLADKPSWKETEKGLNKIADTLGRNRPAREIEPDEITDVLRPIFERGAPAMADHVRSYIRAAYSWGLKSEHDYRNTSSRRFRLVYNPAAGIPTEPKKVGTRWLERRRVRRPLALVEMPGRSRPSALFARRPDPHADRPEGGGDRASSRGSVGRYAERIIDWSKTKNLQPHAVPGAVTRG